MEEEIIQTMSRLLEKTGIEDAMPSISASVGNKTQFLETSLINLKSLYARYEKGDALDQIKWLMNTITFKSMN
jgi:hypothetical protein